MAGGIIRAAVAAHSPRMGIEENAPDFVRPLIAGLREMGEAIRADRPDVIVVHSTHWVCTFMWYVTTQAVHKGVCVGDEIPDFIPGSPYQYKGDPEFAKAIIGEMTRWNTARRVTLFFGVRRADDLYDMPALHRIAALNRWLTIVPCVSDDPTFIGEHGNLSDVVARHGSWKDHDVFLCGSPDMTRATLSRLRP
jgi:hypothetical protein